MANTTQSTNPLQQTIDQIIAAITGITAHCPSDFDKKMVLDQMCKNSHFWMENHTKQAMEIADEITNLLAEREQTGGTGDNAPSMNDNGLDTKEDYLAQRIDAKAESVDYWTAYFEAAKIEYKAHEGEDWKPAAKATKQFAKPGHEKRISANLARFKKPE